MGNYSIMFLIRRRKFAMLLMIAFMLSAIILTSYYTGSSEVTILNIDLPVLISENPRSDPEKQLVEVDEKSFSGVQERLEHRKKVLKEKCERDRLKKYNHIYDHEPYRHFMISQQKHLMYCFLPKVANTNFRRVFLGLEGVVPAEKVPYIGGYDVYFTLDKNFKYLKNFKKEDQTMMLQSYKKFIVVREPLERLLSAYRNKFFHPNQDHRNEYHTKVSEFYRKHPNLKEKHKIDTNFQTRSITFREFLLYWTDSFDVNSYLNEHFTPNSLLCSPCKFNFDYIIRYENLDEEANYMFNELDFGIDFPSRNDNYSSVATNTLIDEFYKPVEGWILKRVWESLKQDFEYFSYKLPAWYMEKMR